MVDWLDYKGLQVPNATPTGTAGLNLKDDLQSLVDWSPQSVWDKTSDPTVNDDVDLDYYPGSFWLNTTTESLFLCTDNTDAAAVWVAVPIGDGKNAQVYDVYDNAGGQTFSSGTITVNLDTVRKNSDGAIFGLASDVLTITDTATYVFLFRVSTDGASSTIRTTSKCWLERDTGGGFAEVDGSRGFMYNRLLNVGDNTATVQLVLDVTSGDQFRIRANRVNGTDTIKTIADGSGLTVFKFAKPGSSGGGGEPAGANTQVQFNDSGAFGADAGFTFDSTNDILDVGNLQLDGPNNTLASTDTDALP